MLDPVMEIGFWGQNLGPISISKAGREDLGKGGLRGNT